ncbi:MAG TPA: Uma2 family endonuclease [Tepidisphaeraceae bacterium]|jgi:Uma2 family endonuclease|nr:Uma2 family endonuclease [Tepidisphaeraceae bacterium]
MTALGSSASVPPPSRKFVNAAEWHHALGDVPLARIIVDPPPGTATEADLLRLVEHDKRLCELIDGTLVEKAMGFWEGQITAQLIGILVNFVSPRGLGSIFAPDSTMRMRSGHVRLPDVSFIARQRMPKTREAIPTVAPDLAVEVLSESNTTREIALKLREYFQSGTRLAWVIDPQHRTVAVYRGGGEPTMVHNEQGTLDGEEVLPELRIAIADLFRDVPR